MSRMEDAKKRYHEIPVPEELPERVRNEIEKADKQETGGNRKKNRKFLKRTETKGLVAAAAAMAVFITALNTSTVFAESIDGIPVIGAVARVLTFRSYQAESDDLKISVDIPAIDIIAEETGEAPQSVNEEIYNMCSQYAEEAVKRAEEYKQAFLDTGGTEEEWAAHNIEIRVDFDVKAQTDKYLSVAVMRTENWNSAYNEIRYYNFDLETGKEVTLADLLGDDYAQIADADILQQIKEREETGAIDYWEEDFAGVADDTVFYINEAENPVIVFESYEIAPGAAGEPEFEITK